MRKRDRILTAFRRVLLGDVYRRLEQLEARVGQLGVEVLPAGHRRSDRPLAERVSDLERVEVLRRPIGTVVKGGSFLG